MFRELTRKQKQLSNEECITILKEETRGVLSVLGDDDYPYGMPMNHWYNEDDGKIYFHCGKVGHRHDALAIDRVLSCVGADTAAADGFCDFLGTGHGIVKLSG